MNPGINPYPGGLFWTMAVPPGSVEVQPGAGRAVFKGTHLLVQDYGDFNNALNNGPSLPATVSFEVRWSGVDQRLNIKNPVDGFGGEFVRGSAQMEWSAIVGQYSFQSDPLETSSSDFASLGTERNGVFFPRQ
jgi:hypothetical protein